MKYCPKLVTLVTKVIKFITSDNCIDEMAHLHMSFHVRNWCNFESNISEICVKIGKLGLKKIQMVALTNGSIYSCKFLFSIRSIDHNFLTPMQKNSCLLLTQMSN